MENQIKDVEWGFYDYLGAVIPFINIILWIMVIYAIVKLYRKVIKYLDKNS